MHISAMASGDGFAVVYGKPGFTVIDIGGQNVNGSLRSCFESRGMKYISVDMVEHPSVDIVVQPGERLPFEDGSVDMVVSTSCFEHDPCFWLTFREICRIVKHGGYIYVNAPSTGSYHKYPGDNYRFYKDTSQALAFWSGKEFAGLPSQPVTVRECFYLMDKHRDFNDFVCVWERCADVTTEIVLHDSIWNQTGPLKAHVMKNNKDCVINVDTQSHKLVNVKTKKKK
jgi:SAM-dependent methyltransferase